MKTTPAPIQLALLAALFLFPTLHLSFAGEGTRGGGQLKRLGWGYVSRALLDKTVCDPKTGDQIVDGNREMPAVLEAIGNLDWYLAFDLERRLRSMDFCETEKLVTIDTADDPEWRVNQETGNFTVFEQGGIYTPTRIYLDRLIIQNMRPYAGLTREGAKAIFYHHEIGHSYLHPEHRRRNASILEIEKTFAQVYLGRITSREQLYSSLRSVDFMFPLNVDALEGNKEKLLFALESTPRKRARLLAETDGYALESLFAPIHIASSYALLTEDSVTIDRINQDPLRALLGPFCRAQDREVIKHLAEKMRFTSIDPAATCLFLTDDHSSKNRRFISSLLKLVRFEDSWHIFLDRLSSKQVIRKDGRQMISSSAFEISATQADSRAYRPVTELLPVYERKWDTLLASTLAVTWQLERLADDGQIDRLIAMTAENPKFYEAFSIISAGKQIELLTAIEPVIPGATGERELGKRALENSFKGFLKTLLGRLDPSASQRISQAIDWSKLGYSL